MGMFSGIAQQAGNAAGNYVASAFNGGNAPGNPQDFITGLTTDLAGRVVNNAINQAPGSNFRQAPGQRPGVEIGSPGGMMPPGNLAGIAEQSQQMANNPIYGQGSPFQPQQNIGGLPAIIGNEPVMPMGGGDGKGGFNRFVPKPYNPSMGGTPELYDQFNRSNNRLSADLRSTDGMNFQEFVKYQQMPIEQQEAFDMQHMQNPFKQPIYGPGMPLPMMPDGGSVGMNPLQGTLPRSNLPFAIGNEPVIRPPNRGQRVGGPVDRPIFGGGLRPAPRNYRPPVRRPNLRSFGRR